MAERLVSNADVVIEANHQGGATGSPTEDTYAGDIIFVTSGVERARLKSDGTSTGIFLAGKVALAYGVSVATDASLADHFTIVATDGVAFTIANPTNAVSGRRIVYDVKNSSGGALGAITWGVAFLLAGAFTNPASTKRRTIAFYFDGTNWVEEARAAADI